MAISIEFGFTPTSIKKSEKEIDFSYNFHELKKEKNDKI